MAVLIFGGGESSGLPDWTEKLHIGTCLIHWRFMHRNNFCTGV